MTTSPKNTSKKIVKRARTTKKKAVLANKHANPAKYPRHSLSKALRIPKAILDQNAGQECSDQNAAKFVGVSYNGPFKSEIASAKNLV